MGTIPFIFMYFDHGNCCKFLALCLQKLCSQDSTNTTTSPQKLFSTGCHHASFSIDCNESKVLCHDLFIHIWYNTPLNQAFISQREVCAFAFVEEPIGMPPLKLPVIVQSLLSWASIFKA